MNLKTFHEAFYDTHFNSIVQVKMKFLSSSGLFESMSFSYKLNKLGGYICYSVHQDRFGDVVSTTTILDFIIFSINLLFSCLAFLSQSSLPMTSTSGSLILDIGILLISKLLILHPILLILMNFINRHDCFKLIKNLNWIDAQVSG